MRLINLGANKTKIVVDLDEYFFSYNTCVAGFTSGEGYWRTTEKFSRTTSKHINQYLDGATNVTEVDQSDIELAMVALSS